MNPSPIPGRPSGQSAALAAALCLCTIAGMGHTQTSAATEATTPTTAASGVAEAAPAPQQKQAATPTGSVKAVDPAGLEAALASQKGKVIVLNFWATWCEPCREEFPDLVRFAKEQAARVSLITVSLDDPAEAASSVRGFLDEMKAPGLRLIKAPGDPDAFINSVDPAWSGALPATFVHRPDGTRAHAVHDTVTYVKLTEMVRPLLAAN